MIRTKRPYDDGGVTNGVLRAEVHRSGHKPTYRTFDTQVEAHKWVCRVEAEIDTGFYIGNSAAEKMTLVEGQDEKGASN
jgi:hypothetical protein